MRISVRLDAEKIRCIEKMALESSVTAMELLHTDLVASETMPFDTGNMQNNDTFVEESDNGAVLVTGSPQSRRLYYHPEYNFQRGKNANAGGEWLVPYLNGSKSDFVQVNFTKIFKEKTGL